MQITYKVVVLLVFGIYSATVFASNDRDTKHVQLLWLLNGLKNTYECDIPVTEQGTTKATCHDHEIINLKTGEIIGTATDATADVLQVGEGLVGTGTTFFRLPQGTLVVRGTGTIQPVLHGSPVLDGAPVTHIAGIFPEQGANNVLSGTGIFKKARGTFSLLGALDLTNAGSGQSQFHCVYLIDLALKRSRARHWTIGAPVDPKLD